MATRLNQVLAIEKGVKTSAEKALTGAYQLLQKEAPLSGLSRTYQPREENGEKKPDETTLVQVRATDVIANVTRELTELFDVTATKEYENCRAKADVVIDGKVLVKDAPVTYLLFLEKKLVDLHTFASKLPTLNPAERWTWNAEQGFYQTPPAETVSTKKVLRNHVKAEATDKHPAQVETYTEDVPVGTWSTIKYSGALPVTRVRELTARVEALQKAVKLAREEANNLPIATDERRIGKAILDYLFD